jgi:hypothetical protein
MSTLYIKYRYPADLMATVFRWHKFARCFPKYLTEVQLWVLMHEYIRQKTPFHAVKVCEFPDVVNQEVIKKMFGDVSAVIDYVP